MSEVSGRGVWTYRRDVVLERLRTPCSRYPEGSGDWVDRRYKGRGRHRGSRVPTRDGLEGRGEWWRKFPKVRLGEPTEGTPGWVWF